MKRIMTFFCILTIIFSMSITVFAADETFSMIQLEKQSGSEYIEIDDVFIDAPSIMPGAHMEYSMVVRNSSSYTATIYFHVEVPEYIKENTVEMDLIKKISMCVLQDGKEIYCGNLSGKDLKNGNISVPVNLGSFNPGSKTELTAVMDVPIELDNSYSLDSTQTKWIFNAEGDEEGSPGTGDTAPLLAIVLVMIGSGLYVASYILKKKRYYW